jgi:cell division protein FtsQ
MLGSSWYFLFAAGRKINFTGLEKATTFWMMKSTPCATQPTPEKSENLRWGRKVLVIILIMVSMCWAWLKISNPNTFPIRTVKIIGITNHVNHQLLQNTVTAYLSRGMLWINIRDLEQAVNQLPWVENATLTRKWPDEIFIQITEQTPIARWNNTQLLNNHGNVFTPGTSTAIPDLPSLYGPNNLQNTVWEGYQAMNGLLSTIGLKIISASMSPRQVWDVYLNNGTHLILGREDVLKRLKKFVSVYPKIKHQTNDMQYVDLRYSDGFAVKWKNNPAKN